MYNKMSLIHLACVCDSKEQGYSNHIELENKKCDDPSLVVEHTGLCQEG